MRTSILTRVMLVFALWWPFILVACEPLPPSDAGGSGGSGAQAAPILPGEDDTSASAPFAELWRLTSELTSDAPPAVGQAGVSFLHFALSGEATVGFVSWAGELSSWYQDASAYFAEPAAYAERHLALLHRPNDYGIYDRGGTTELSLTPETFKESLAVNAVGIGWMDYGELGSDGAPDTLSSLVLQTWDGVRRSLTDSTRYRTGLDMSETHAAYVEYSSTSEGAPGQIVVATLDGSEVFMVAPSAHHQDQPTTDGDWVVWVEFSGPSTTVVRAAQLTTRIVHDLTDASAFRAHPDIRGSLVVWDDHRSGNGDIYVANVAESVPVAERLVVAEASHSTSPRLVDGGLVWIESYSDRLELRLGYFAPGF